MAAKEFGPGNPMYGRPTREPVPPSPLETQLPKRVSHADLQSRGQPPQDFRKGNANPLPGDYPGGPSKGPSAVKGNVK
jgi:hypothetical protein